MLQKCLFTFFDVFLRFLGTKHTDKLIVTRLSVHILDHLLLDILYYLLLNCHHEHVLLLLQQLRLQSQTRRVTAMRFQTRARAGQLGICRFEAARTLLRNWH